MGNKKFKVFDAFSQFLFKIISRWLSLESMVWLINPRLIQQLFYLKFHATLK